MRRLGHRRPRRSLRARRALDAGRSEVVACERALSRFDPDSDLTRLNGAGGGWVTVGERLLAALRSALQARTDTAGRFDPTILPALVAAGYDRSFEQLTPRAPHVARSWHAGAQIELDTAGGRARVEAGAAVDLGGIGKGFSAVRALEAMRGRVARPPRRSGRPGRRHRRLGHVARGGALAARASPTRASRAGRSARSASPPAASRRRAATGAGSASRASCHHLIDPGTGAPARGGPLAVTVVAADAAAAEAHATALAVTPARAARAYVAERPGLGALVVPDTGAPIVAGEIEFSAPRPRVRAAFPR